RRDEFEGLSASRADDSIPARRYDPAMKNTLCRLIVLSLAALPGSVAAQPPPAEAIQRPGPKILVLGDSITAAGHYVDDIETYLLLHDRKNLPTLVALGLGSETVTGLTEPVHPFPRPNVHDRLDRVLKT